MTFYPVFYSILSQFGSEITSQSSHIGMLHRQWVKIQFKGQFHIHKIIEKIVIRYQRNIHFQKRKIIKKYLVKTQVYKDVKALSKIALPRIGGCGTNIAFFPLCITRCCINDSFRPLLRASFFYYTTQWGEITFVGAIF